MILLTLAMIRARRAQALTVALMAAIAVGAAVASGAYVGAAQQRILADDVAAAPSEQKSLIVTELALLKAAPDDKAGLEQVAFAKGRAFERIVPPLVQADGFGTAFAARFNVFLANRPFQKGDVSNGALEFREDFCEHVVLVRGRCVSGPGEALVSAERAKAGLDLSQILVATPVRFVVGDPTEIADVHFEPTDAPTSLVVVGVYEPRDAGDLYWGRTADEFKRSGGEPVLTDRRTLASTAHTDEDRSVVAYALPGTITLDRTGAIRDRVKAIQVATNTFSGSTDIASLMATIETNSRTVALAAGVATLPLIALCWYVLFLTIAYTNQARRTELGMVKLRGVAARDQWWIAVTESLLPVLAGAVLGYLLGHLAVWAYSRVVFGPLVTVPVTTRPLPYAAAVLAGSVLAGLIAMRRDLASSATELLRRVSTPRRGWGGLTLAVLVAVLAGMAVIQLRSAPAGEPTGLGRLAPALSIIALGLLGAVLVDPVMGRIGTWALRRGRIGLALGGLYIGRRRSGSRLLALATVAVALLTFSATAAGFAEDERVREVGAATGADEVLTVSTTTPFNLLNAVRSVDPAGAYAMAAMPVATTFRGGHILAVDSPRLPTAAIWPKADGQVSVQDATRALRATTAAPIEVRGSGLAVFAKRPAGPTKFSVGLIATLAQLDSGKVVGYTLIEPATPGAPYTAEVSCSTGCRLVDLQLISDRRAPVFSSGADPQFLLESVRQTGPDREVVSGADLARWVSRSRAALRTEPTDTGLRVTAMIYTNGLGQPLLPQDNPASLPAVNATNVSIPLQGDQQITTALTATAATLPRVGLKSGFTDLEALVHAGLQFESTAEVWLGPTAPPDVVDRLTAAGLTVTATTRMSDQLAAAEKRPSAITLRFLLVVALCGLLLGAVGLIVAAAVERRGRSEELRALRIQGLAPGSALRAILVSYVLLVGVAAVLGLVSGIAVWYATGAFLPLVDVPGAVLAIPLLPGTGTLVATIVGGGLMVVVAVAIAMFLARSSNPSGAARTERTNS